MSRKELRKAAMLLRVFGLAGPLSICLTSALAQPTVSVTSSIPVGNNPQIVAINPSGTTVYVSNAGDNTVSVISTASNKVVTNIPVGKSPNSLAVSKDGKTVYAGNQGGGVSVISTATNTVSSTIATSGFPVRDLALTPDGGKLYLALESGGLGRIVTATGVLTIISDITCPEGLSVTPDGSRLYVNYQCAGPGGSGGHDAVGVFSTATDSLTTSITGAPNVGRPNPRISPNGSQFWENGEDACSGTSYNHTGCPATPGVPESVVNVFQTAGNSLVRSIGFTNPDGAGSTISFLPDSSLAFIGGGSTLKLINTSTFVTSSTVPIAASGSLVFNKGGTIAYAPVPSQNTVAVLSISTSTSATDDPLAITSTTLPYGITGVLFDTFPGATTLQAKGGTGTYSWTATGLPPGLSLSSGGSLSGTPGTTGTFSVTVTVVDGSMPQQSASKTYSLAIVAPLTFTPAILPNGVMNVPYPATTFQAQGGTPPYSFTASPGLPPGLSLSSAGVLSGTPTAAGTFSVTVAAKDSASPPQPASRNLSLTISPAFTFSCTPVTGTVQVGTAYSVSCAAMGGTPPYHWSTAGMLPAGVSLSAATGTTVTIGGTPTTAGQYSYQVQLTDSGMPPQTAPAQTLSGAIQPPGLAFICTPVSGPVQVGTAYSVSCTASGGTPAYRWSTAGTLPAGVSLSAATGTTVTISGTPTTAGPYTYQVQLTDSGMPAQTAPAQTFSGNVVSPGLAFGCTPTSGPAQVGTPYSASCTAAGGTPPYHWSTTGTLPAGITLGAATGTTVTIGGTPTTAGAYSYQIELTDSAAPPQTAAQQTYTGNIARGPTTLTFTCTPVTGPVQVGTPYSASCTASGGTSPYHWSTGTLPAGITLSAATGTKVTIGGTPTTAGAYSYPVQLTDSGMPPQTAAPQTFAGNIQPPPPALTFTCTPVTGPTQVGMLYSATCTAAGGTPPYLWSTGTLPAGLTLSASTGTTVTIGGTPSAVGPYNYQVQLTDSGVPPQTAPPQTYSGTTVAGRFTVSPTALTFMYQQGDTATPAPQSLSVYSVPAGLTDTVAASTAKGGNWLGISSNTGGTTPNAFPVTVNVAGLAPDNYTGQIAVSPGSGTPVVVPVSLIVIPAAAPKLSVSPLTETFALSQGGAPVSGQVTVSNTGGGTLRFSARVTGGQNWLTLAGNASGSATPSSPAPLSFTVDPSQVNAGIYSGSITVEDSASATSVSVGVTLAVSKVSQSILLSQNGMTFTAVTGGPQPAAQSFAVLNQGQGSLNWTAQAQTIASPAGVNWLNATPGNGASPGTGITVSVNQAGLQPGQYYGSVNIAASGAVNSPQSVSVLLNVVAPQPSPGGVLSTGGLILGGTAGSAENPKTQISLFNSSSTPGSYTTTTFTANGIGWLTITPPNGILNPGANPVTVQADLSRLPAGVQNGNIGVGFGDGSSGTVQVTVIAVGSGGSASGGSSSTGSLLKPASADVHPLATGCSATRVVALFKLPSSQATPQVSVAQPLQVQIVDDCNVPVTAKNGGAAQVTFSNKDAAVDLSDVGGGIWEGTWTPATAAANVTLQVVAQTAGNGVGPSLVGGTTMTVSVSASAPNAAAQPKEAVNAASALQTPPQIVVPGGYVAIYGSVLAANGTCEAGTVPLPTTLNNTQLLLGDTPLPLSYACPPQVNGLIPQNLNSNASYQLVVVRGSTRSVPVPVTVQQLQPGIYTQDNSGSGQGAIQIAGTTLLAAPAGDGSRPVQSGVEYLTIYGTGFGPVAGSNGEPPPADGEAAQLPTIYRTTNSVTATVGGVAAPVVFSGLTPTLVALYQVNVQVPAGVPTGDAVPVVLTVTNTQDGTIMASNTVTIAVQ